MEQTAASAERASIKYKQVEFMSERIGVVYDGVDIWRNRMGTVCRSQ